ncbi:type I glyceraldehyde-3-phosphate dehydrogenase [Marinivivus vitaminiproducens]|uniref:type I glyceraldehyde-3-phosphate dehydrogenase n=1 Tax=Marinivivus vitaminiproducens TaxID=3035935 RepID=UPI002799F691|nr:type I glyceraldehyde-3-phosphate dehydrogenase [Geminicoccaceae bacterium SCSIO 64248]
MTVRVAINGFGRIGRNVLRAIIESGRTDVEVVAINDLAPPATNAHLLKYDSVHGPFGQSVTLEGDVIRIGDRQVHVVAQPDVTKLPWSQHGIDVVMECTGRFTKREDAAKHIDAGARKVLVSAPATGADKTIVFGVNDGDLTAEDTVVSNASCTTNCIAPVMKVLHEGLGVVRGHMTTIHSYTNDQHLLDVFHKDLYRARAAAMSMIPTSTGAAKAVGLVLPDLKGKLDGVSVRVPTPNVSLVDVTFVPSRGTSAEEVNALLKAAASGPLKGILAVTDEPLVSSDFNHNAASSTVDLNATKAIEGELVRVASWYDNEWGFSNRMSDTAAALGAL